MQAIVTKYLPPTNHLGSRIRASCAAKTIIVPWDYELNPDQNHTKAAKALATQLGWDYGTWFGGGAPDDKGNVYVCALDDRLGSMWFNVSPQ